METNELNIFKGTRARYVTLGCKLNFAETASLRDRLLSAGARDAQPGETADLCVVNTCSVTETSEQKCRQAINRLVRENPNAVVLVMGCYAQLKASEIAAMRGVDVVVGTEQKGKAVAFLAEALSKRRKADTGATHRAEWTPSKEIRTFVPSCSRGNRTRFFLKIQDGCNYYCTYCTIPIARGRSRSATIADTVAQAERVAREGGREIVLTGVNLGDFGQNGERFIDLLKALDGIEGVKRYRISSIEPNLLTDEVIDFCAGSRAFMPHFHIPLQSGSDDVLRLMHRRYDTAFFARKLEQVVKARPDTFIGVDVIVGTRGETASLFEESLSFVESLPVAQLHVFTYSERPGTKALEIPHSVTPAEKHERCKRLMAVSEAKRRAFYQRYAGTERPVLWEHGKQNGTIHGWTDNYIKVEASSGREGRNDNTLTTERLGSMSADGSCLTVA